MGGEQTVDTPEHDLYTFFKRTSNDIAVEYERICRRVKEDPGTAGDQGEENWKELIQSWIPSYFHVVTKGRIIGDSGKTSPQIDVLVLSPDYPKMMLNCKEYLAGGVVAAFECKTTLRRFHIEEFMQHSKKIRELALQASGSPRKDLQSTIYYGLLAHSHEWKGEKSTPKKNIEKAIHEFDDQEIRHPREMPDIVCVSDVGVWEANKAVLPGYTNGKDISGDYVMSAYCQSNGEEDFFTPVGAFIFDLLEFIAWQYPSVRNLVSYMRNLNLTGSGEGNMKLWNLDVLSPETRNNINKLVNGGFWNEWALVV